MVSVKAIELIVHAFEKSGDSYDKISAATNISKTTLSRLVKHHAASRYTLDILAAYFEIGEEYQKLVGEQDHSCAFAAELSEELRSTRAYYEDKATSVRSHYEEQLASIRELNARQEEERNRERETLQRNYDRSVNYLKEESARLRAERDECRKELTEARAEHAAFAANADALLERANARADDLDRRRHHVFIGMLAALIIVTIGFVIALKSDAVI